MKVIHGAAAKVEDPLVMVVARSAPADQDEDKNLAAVLFMGKYNPDTYPERNPPLDPEVLEALMYAQQALDKAISQYSAALMNQQIERARDARQAAAASAKREAERLEKQIAPEAPKKTPAFD